MYIIILNEAAALETRVDVMHVVKISLILVSDGKKCKGQ